ncbi:cytochrome P460 family protein, partial [Paraburkholderia azotifigens]|uniref:cytochrome P460 family protein n=1 Tax=Paraburkholderia azotifigens TaxID=2057004 RepID=UPI00317805BB
MRPIRTAYIVLSAALLVGAVSADQAIAESAKPAQAAEGANGANGAKGAKEAKGAKGAKVAASPIYGVTIPEGYRKWQVIAPAEEGAPLDELRVVLGNPAAVKAIENSTLPYPDGAMFVKLAYKRKQSPDFESATVPGQPTTVQVMVK